MMTRASETFGNSPATYRSKGAIVGWAALTNLPDAVRMARAAVETASVISRASKGPDQRRGSGMLADRNTARSFKMGAWRMDSMRRGMATSIPQRHSLAL